MDFIDLAKKRFSSRNFLDAKVEPEKLNKVLEAGRIAPSAVNKQPWIFIVVQEEDQLKGMHEVYDRDWFATAPLAIVVCGDHKQSWTRSDGKDHCDIDVAIASDHMTLAATALGLSTCWVCNFDRDKLSELLQLPSHIEPMVIFPLGYPADNKAANRHVEDRKPLDKIVYKERFK
ncbi:MAG: nitroreductase family protein [Bacteroidales bacterium]